MTNRIRYLVESILLTKQYFRNFEFLLHAHEHQSSTGDLLLVAAVELLGSVIVIVDGPDRENDNRVVTPGSCVVITR